MKSKILYIDIETSKSGEIKDLGALFNDQEMHENKLSKLEEWIAASDYICGHNVIGHDIPLLEKILGGEVFANKKIIDTLLWSPLLFADNPYHKLVKGYKIVNEDQINNPLSDCKLTQQLLRDEYNKYRDLDIKIQRILAGLLGQSSHYSGFLELMNYKKEISNIGHEIRCAFQNKICDDVDIEQAMMDHPIELAYALALINTKENISILPQWVVRHLPETPRILDKIRFNYCGNTTCAYCNSEINPRQALLKYFNYDDFRSFEDEGLSLQKRTVKAGLSAESFVAVFPTGGGKSLTFQLPALMKGSLTRQLTVVISPLVSLMKDQVDNLKERFGIVNAAAINGLLSPLERQEAIERVENGDIHLLYLSPESLRSNTILRILKERSIARFVIDEAHCFSSWGQDFRVDYLYIPEFIRLLEANKLFSRIPVSCFTATAKPQVIDDIKSYFKNKLDVDLGEYITRASRTNLRYEVLNIENPDEKKKELIKILSLCEKPAIIYASRTKRVEELHGFIERHQFNSTFFHGKLDVDVKKANMDAFMNNEKEIIVATSAFGMGVDKDNVKTVIHYNISDSLENYVQEAGRAGRDEKIKAKCYILFNEQDLNKHFSLLNQTKLNRKEIQQVWQSLKYLSKYRRNNSICNSALEIARNAGWDTEIRELETKIKTSISILEDQGFLNRRQNSTSVFADSLLLPKIDQALERIQNCASITKKQIENCARVLQRIVKDDVVKVDYIADRTGLKLRQINDSIEILRDLQILGDSRDLTAFINLTSSKNSSKNILKRYMQIEAGMQKILTKDIKISMRQLNQNLLDNGVENASIDAIKRILNYWDVRNLIQKERVNREHDLYKIKVRDSKEIDEDIKWRHDLASDVYRLLEQFYLKQKEELKSEDRKEFPLRFSMMELRDANQILGIIKEENIKLYEKTLLFLNQIKALQLEGGFMIMYNRLNIQNIDKSIPQFTMQNYEKLSKHYQNKIEQIHIVGEYAKKRLENYDAALSYVNDYFTLPYKDFLKQYFPKRKSEIRTPLTPTRFKEITTGLDTDQLKIVNNGKSKNILVLAGPGSGKTRVLVHKIASLLLQEDIKPEQFLMLTFSKAASLEFRSRVNKLVPEFSGLIKITTFHGFCFQLLGQQGDIAKSTSIIKDCIAALKSEDVDVSSIVNKSVLLLDEFQDVNTEEWHLIQTIMKISGDIRVIAVGDDDQNIYEFRGSSNQHMLKFKDYYHAARYSLIKNYRSSVSIVQFNNELLKRIPNRLKEETLEPVDKKESPFVRLIRYENSTAYLERPCAESIITDNFAGTRAILVRTNKHALILRTVLSALKQKTRLITGIESFSLDRLIEFRSFTSLLKEKQNDAGIIFNKDWEVAKMRFKSKFRSSIHFKVCRAIILKFEENYNNQKQLVDWYDYISEIRMEDAIHPESNTILISTMHKAKGKEFDHVYLLLDDYKYDSSEAKRLLYVASSRAKKTLHIHTNSGFFDGFQADKLEIAKYIGKTEQPDYFELILNHKDINLGSQKFAKRNIKSLKSGDPLKKDFVKFANNQGLGLANEDERNVLLFSKDFIDKKYNKFIENGYHLAGGRVEYLVYWYDQNDDREYLVVLPKVRFERNQVAGRINRYF